MLKQKLLTPLATIALLVCGCAQSDHASYTADWSSLAKHEPAPQWFQDAKFGIYFHWGPYCVPEFMTEWYPRNMHIEGSPVYEYHLERYGHPNEFGYHDLIPLFTAEHFDAKQWADLFKKSGAKFAGLVAEHHDGFAMWESELTPWNAKQMGPKRDIVGEMATHIKANDMKFVTTWHHARNLQRYTDPEVYRAEMQKEYEVEGRRFSLSHFPYYDNMPPKLTAGDSLFKYLYGTMPEDEWCRDIWFGKLREVIDKYQPDIIWFDSWLNYVPEQYVKEFAAYYFNSADKDDKEVVIIRKQEDLPLDFSVENLEIARKSEISRAAWQTDATITNGSWSYTRDMTVKPAAQVLHTLVDIVSKNGVLLLNISPTYQGVIPDDQQQVLLRLGKWLETNGEAIYNTRAWISYGEGPTIQPEGSFKNHEQFQKLIYTPQDVRYTRNGKDAIYVITLGEPQPGQVYNLRSFAQSHLGVEKVISKVSLLGSDVPVAFKQSDQRLIITAPEAQYDMAAVFKVEYKMVNFLPFR